MADSVRRLGFSRARMFELFKAQTGFTPNDYLQRLRVEKARQLLRQTSLSVTDIALDNGVQLRAVPGLSSNATRANRPRPSGPGAGLGGRRPGGRAKNLAS